MVVEVIKRISRYWMKLRLQPIRVFCLHHVCENFDAEAMHSCDWIALDEFKEKINALLSQGYKFISLTEAYNHLNNDWFRRKKYAVLTFDDGYKSLLNLLPWLEEQNMSATLFINGKYLDGKSFRDTPKEQYLTHEELFSLSTPFIEIGHHGWEHLDASRMGEKEFDKSLQKNIEILSSHPRYIPFWAYTWGHHTDALDSYLRQKDIIPLIITGGKNYEFNDHIDRELL